MVLSSRSSHWRVTLLLTAAVSSTGADGLHAQGADRTVARNIVPVTPLSSALAPRGWDLRPQDALFPVLDDSGHPISRAEIEARVDPSGTAGMLVGGLSGLVLGSLVGAMMHSMVACERVNGVFGPYDNCSPQEDALRGALTGGSIVIGVVGLGLAGWHMDRTTWWEAVAAIRRDRAREAAGTGPR